jgi:hypothetical protein
LAKHSISLIFLRTERWDFRRCHSLQERIVTITPMVFYCTFCTVFPDTVNRGPERMDILVQKSVRVASR